MEKKTWKIIAVLFIILFIFSMTGVLWFWAGTTYWKGESKFYSEVFVDCADNFKKCSNDFKRCSDNYP